MALVADYTYDARCERVIDGDTVIMTAYLVPQRVVERDGSLWFDMGFGVLTLIALADHPVPHEQRFRLLDVDAPEVVGAQREAGLAAQQALEAVLGSGSHIRVRSHKSDKYGRYLADLWVSDVHVNTWLVESGHATRVASRRAAQAQAS